MQERRMSVTYPATGDQYVDAIMGVRAVLGTVSKEMHLSILRSVLIAAEHEDTFGSMTSYAKVQAILTETAGEYRVRDRILTYDECQVIEKALAAYDKERGKC